MYQLLANNLIQRLADGAIIPADPDNRDRQQYAQWCAEGNEPLPAEPTWPLELAMVTAEYKDERERLLNRLAGLAGRAARGGDAAFADALDTLAESLIPLDTHPLVVSAMATQDKAAVRAAFKQAYKLCAQQALSLLPAEQQPAALEQVNKVFK